MLVVDKFHILEAEQVKQDSWEEDGRCREMIWVKKGDWELSVRGSYELPIYVSDKELKEDYIQVGEVNDARTNTGN